MVTDDMALVLEYAQANSEQAFGALVSRHVNLVYSVALRQVRDPHLAEEISQNVFIILARKANSLSPKTILSGWLCRTARYISADALRTQRRRQAREQESQMQSISSESDSAAWNQIGPLLDEALNGLEEREHDAVVLRFFDGKQLKQVGAEMGTTEDAARMRVNRGLEKLRKFFMKRGVTLSATAITGAVAANSVQAAPAGLAATITAATFSGATITTAALAAATKAVTMTALQKTLLAAFLVAAAGVGIYEARQAAQLRAEDQALQQQHSTLTEQLQQLQRAYDDATNKLTFLSDENERLNRNSAEVTRLRSEVASLRAGRNAALEKIALDQTTTSTNSIEQILKILWDKDATEAGDHRRVDAAGQLRKMGPQALQGLAAFRELLHSGNQETSYAGARALAFTSEANPEVFRELSSALSDADPQVRDAASHGVDLVLGYQINNEFANVDTDSTLPTLVQNLRDPDRTVRADTAQTIQRYIERQNASGKSAEPALVVPALIQNLADEWGYARLNAANALREYGDDAKAAIPQLTILLQDPDPQVQGAARNALKRISRVNSPQQ
jgi:RNA polymerase sigma factor (sigma-70 family)